MNRSDLESIQFCGTHVTHHDGDDPSVTTFILSVMAVETMLEFTLTICAAVEMLAAHVQNPPAQLHSSYDVILNGHAGNEVAQV